MTLRTLTHLVFLALVLMAAPALAAPAINQAGADALKPRIEEALKVLGTKLAASGKTLRQEGELMVEPADGYYAVTTPALLIGMGADRIRTVGMIAVNAIPTDDPDVYKVAVALPTPMMDHNAKNEVVGSLSIGQQAMNGIWNMKQMAFTELSAAYKDVRIASAANNTETTIPSAVTTLKLSPAGENLWSGPLETLLTGPVYRKGNTRYTAGTLRIRTVFDRLNLATSAKIDKTIADGTKPADMADDLFLQYLSGAAEGLTATIAANTITWQTKKDDGSVKSGKAQTLNLQSDIKDAQTKNGTLAFAASVDGIASDDASLARMMPSRVMAKGSAAKLDLKSLLAAPDKDARRAVMAQNGSQLVIDTLTLDAPSYGLDANGRLESYAAASFGTAGNLHLVVRGLDDLMAYLASPEAAKGLGIDAVPPPIVAALAMVQMTGVPGKDASGRTTRSYDIVMDKSGGMTLNGADLSAMGQAIGSSIGGAVGKAAADGITSAQ